tara:strand:- start:3658 stop:4275 length:618 start_codon:yes stop_codon:yes gene_type:complete
MSRKYQTLSKKNPANTPSYLNGPQGRCQTYGLPINLAQNNNSSCNILNNISNSQPQRSVTNIGSFLKNRYVTGPLGNPDPCCKNPYAINNNIVKLLDQSQYDISTYLKNHCARAAQCTINPDLSYADYSPSTTKILMDGVEQCCAPPIVKVTKTPDMQSYLSAQYLKNNCLPPPNPTPDNNNPLAPNTIKLRYNIPTGAGTCGGC